MFWNDDKELKELLKEVKSSLFYKQTELDKANEEIKSLRETNAAILKANSDLKTSQEAEIERITSRHKRELGDLQHSLDRVREGVKAEFLTQITEVQNSTTVKDVEIEKLSAELAALKTVGDSEYKAKLLEFQLNFETEKTRLENLVLKLNTDINELKQKNDLLSEEAKSTKNRLESELNKITKSRDELVLKVHETNSKLQEKILGANKPISKNR